MKTTTRNVLLGLMAGGAMLMAGNVGTLTQFHPNTTAKSAEVNANFAAVKTAVNGNTGDIAANKGQITSNKNDIASNANDIATNKSDITSNASDMVKVIEVGRGLVVSRTDGNVTIKKASGYVAVHGSAFNNYLEYNGNCALVRAWLGTDATTGAYFGNASSFSDCSAFATVDIPNGASIKKLTCRVKHNIAADLHVRLYMQNRFVSHTFPFPVENIQKTKMIEATLDAAHGNTTDTQEISGDYTSPPFMTINSTYRSYFIEWDPPQTDTASTDEALYDCKVDYEYH